jgi:hypothetical protein
VLSATIRFTTVQLVPSQRSTTDPFPEPTAKQFVALVHDTPLSSLALALGFGLATTSHAAPFQRSINVFVVDPVVALPTAKQLAAEVHDTAESAELVAPAGIGAPTNDHAVPFHRSINVKPSRAPTAKQSVALEHEMPFKPPVGGLGGFGLAVIDQAGAAPAGAASTVIVPAMTLQTASNTHGHRRIGPPSPWDPTMFLADGDEKGIESF